MWRGNELLPITVPKIIELASQFATQNNLGCYSKFN